MQSTPTREHSAPDAEALRQRFLSEYKNDLETVARNYLERPVTQVVPRRGGLPSWNGIEELFDELRKWTKWLSRPEFAHTGQQWTPLLLPATGRFTGDVGEVFQPWFGNAETKTYGLRLFRQAVTDILDWIKKEKSIVHALTCLVSVSHLHTWMSLD